MKSIFSFIPKFIFAMVFTVVSTATASTNETNEAARIMEAMKLYVQATPMDQLDTRRAELLRQAESILLDVIAKNPASLDAHRKLMGVYLQMRDYPNAIKTMQAAITLSPGDPKLFIALAILYDHHGAYEYAVPVLDQALVLDPGNPLAVDYKIAIQQKIERRNMALESGTPLRDRALTPDDRLQLKTAGLLTGMPMLYVANASDEAMPKVPTATAMARSCPEPSLRTSAGARFTVTRPAGRPAIGPSAWLSSSASKDRPPSPCPRKAADCAWKARPKGMPAQSALGFRSQSSPFFASATFEASQSFGVASGENSKLRNSG